MSGERANLGQAMDTAKNYLQTRSRNVPLVVVLLTDEKADDSYRYD